MLKTHGIRSSMRFVRPLPLRQWRLNPSNVCQHLLAAEEHRVPKAAALALDYLAVHFDEACCACDAIFSDAASPWFRSENGWRTHTGISCSLCAARPK